MSLDQASRYFDSALLQRRLPRRHMSPDPGWDPVLLRVPEPGSLLLQLHPPEGWDPEPQHVSEHRVGSIIITQADMSCYYTSGQVGHI
jgi:hypothetical protein